MNTAARQDPSDQILFTTREPGGVGRVDAHLEDESTRKIFSGTSQNVLSSEGRSHGMDGNLDCNMKMSGPTLTYVSTGHTPPYLQEKDTEICRHWPSPSME